MAAAATMVTQTLDGLGARHATSPGAVVAGGVDGARRPTWQRAGVAGLDLGSSTAVLTWLAAIGWLGASPLQLGIVLTVWFAALVAAGAYRTYELTRLGLGTALAPWRAAIVLIVVLWATTGVATSALLPADQLLAVPLLAGATMAGRAGREAWRLRSGASRPATRVLLVGSEHDVRRTLASVSGPDHRGTGAGRVEPVSAWVTDPGALTADLGVPTGTGDPADWSDLVKTARRRHVDAVVALSGSTLDAGALRRLTWALEGSPTALFVTTGLQDVAPSRAHLSHAGGLGLLHLRAPVRAGAARALMTGFERIAAALGLVALLPLLAVAVLAIRLDSPGSALFRQRRVGREGREFSMLKLRSMSTAQVDLGERNDGHGLLFKLREDPRITPVGAILRRYSLDELPQLWNVVRGDMSLVGPRPALPEEASRYDQDARRRLAVRPGLTGLWQVSGRSDLSWADTVRLDTAYVDNWSPGLDLSILARTVSAVVGHRGAY